MQVKCVTTRVNSGGSRGKVVPRAERGTRAPGKQREGLGKGGGPPAPPITGITRNFFNEIGPVPNTCVDINARVRLELQRVVGPGEVEFATVRRQARLHGDAAAVRDSADTQRACPGSRPRSSRITGDINIR